MDAFVCQTGSKGVVERPARGRPLAAPDAQSNYVKGSTWPTQPIEEPESACRGPSVTLIELYDGQDTTAVRVEWTRTKTSDHPEGRTRCAAGRGAPGKVFGENAGPVGIDRDVIGRVADFHEGTHRVVEVEGREIGVFNIEGVIRPAWTTAARIREGRCARASEPPAR